MNRNEFILREVNRADFPRLIKLFQEFAEFENHSEMMVNSVKKMEEEADFFNGFVALDSRGKVIAYATYFFCYFTWSGKCLYMDDLYVQESHRKQGIGTRLIKRIITKAKEEKCYKVRWQVSSWNNPAKKFYESLGAQIDDVEMNCDLFL